MPGKNEIRASMLMTFLAAPQSFVAQIAAPVQNFAYLLDARKRELESSKSHARYREQRPQKEHAMAIQSG